MHSCSNDGVIQLGPFSSDAMFEVVEINSPDLNPVDYSVWSILQEKVYKTRITDLDNLKHRIRTEWAKLVHADFLAVVSYDVVRFNT